jgi:HK97 family phage major capsid protein
MTDRIAFTGTMETEGRRIRGSVKLVGARTFRNGEWVEVDPNALMKASAANTIARWDHDPAKVLGRVSNDTLTVTRTPEGIAFETADLPHTTYADDALELVRGGYAGGSSFEIEGLRSSVSTDPTDGLRVRRYTSIKTLVDVSPVIDPAFASMAAAFNKESDVTEIIEEPVAPAPVIPQPAPQADPKPAFSVNETAEATERFARTLETSSIEAAMDNIVAASGGELSGVALDQYEAYAKVYGERKKADFNTAERASRMKALHDIRLGRIPKAPASEQFASDDYKHAFAQYLRSGNSRLMEQFAQTVAGDGTQGGFTVPDGFLTRLTTRLKAFGGVAGLADEITTTTGESLRWPYLDDTANSAAIATEGVQVASGGADLVFDSIELGAFEYDATGTGNAPLEISLSLLQDSAFDIEGRVGDALGQRIGRKQASDLANGTGSSQPVGLFTKTTDVMSATVASLAAPEHVFQVDAAYRELGNCRFVMSDTTLVKFWQAQSTTNQPLFIPGGASIGGAPHGTLYGYPVSIDPAAGNLVAFGDIKLGYIVRRVRGVQILVDPYTAQKRRAVAYHAWARMDANIQDANAYSVSTYASVTADT